MHTASFAHSVIGQVVQAPGGIGGECVDLADLYRMQVWGGQPVRANAVDWAGIPLSGMHWEANTPRNYPPTGALIVWHAYMPLGIGVNGHIAVVITADVNNILSLDQNWTEGGAVALVWHDYGGVTGWHRPA